MRIKIEKMKNYVNDHKMIFICGLLTVLAILPFIIQDNYIKGILVKMLMYGTLASSLNIINGYSGQNNLGQAGFMCIGAYTAGIIATSTNVNFVFTLIFAGIVAAIFGYLVSLPTLKLTGIYLSIVTLGFSEIVRLTALNWTPVTGGAMGIKGIPNPSIGGFLLNKPEHYYLIALAMLVICLFCMNRVIKSRVGRAWLSIREDEAAAKSLGVETYKYKSINFVYGALWAGVGGAFMAYYYRFLSADMFILDEGFNVLAMIVVGGQGTLIGPLLGSVIVNTLTEVFRFASEYRMVVYAILIIGMMWWRPQGLAGASDSILAGGASLKTDKKNKDKKVVKADGNLRG